MIHFNIVVEWPFRITKCAITIIELIEMEPNSIRIDHTVTIMTHYALNSSRLRREDYPINLDGSSYLTMLFTDLVEFYIGTFDFRYLVPIVFGGAYLN